MGEGLSSYDVTSLFTSVPIDPALNMIRDLLEKDEKLNDRTVLSIQNIMELLGFCLHNTGGSRLSQIFCEHENQSGLLVIQLIYIKLYRKKETKFWKKNLG